MNGLPDRKMVTRIMRGVTLPQIAAFVVALGLLLVGVAIIASQWAALQDRVLRNTERIVKVETLQQTNDQRIANQHIRLSALETYNKELVESMRNVSLNTKRMVELLTQHVFPRTTPEGAIEITPEYLRKTEPDTSK